MTDRTQYATPEKARRAIRDGEWTGPTSGLVPGAAQANLVMLPREWAYDFLLFAQRNPKPCPVLDVTEMGDPEPRGVAPGADIRTDLPRYRVWRKGELAEEREEVASLWDDSMVGFLLGCSFTFEWAMLQAHIPVRHIELGRNVPMYRTTVPCREAGRLSGTMVVSMRPIPEQLVTKTVIITSHYPSVHGAPVQIGHPEGIGITDLDAPDFGDPVPVREGEVPVFWACGVTPQSILMSSRPPFAITHAPGHMFICSVRDSEYAIC
ncbi:MAG: putative hydro-lyase [Synergistales bacterium]|nr:putative hydro-lyase [Synergistales bacterium]